MNWIQNRKDLEITPERKLILDIAEAGLDAINTESVVKNSLSLSGTELSINGTVFHLSDYQHIYVLGFGKASAEAAEALEAVLGEKISDGIVISLHKSNCTRIQTFEGTHPLPSKTNVEVAERMARLIEKVTERDLVITLISGGGSALLCWTQEECEQGIKLYNNYLKTGDDIKGLNTVRKHISQVKGGGLAKMLYPATVIGLIFSDVAGNNDHIVDSGPTYYDESTTEDAKAIIQKYNLGEYTLTETPKDKKYFEKVYNITLVSNRTALEAMKNKAESLGKKVTILSSELLNTAKETMELFQKNAVPQTILLAGSEIKLLVDKPGGKGGRNTYLTTFALQTLQDTDTFAAIASDGLDNSDCAGALVDNNTKTAIDREKMSLNDYLENFDGYTLFEKTGHELVFTGPTKANVSDYLIFYRS